MSFFRDFISFEMISYASLQLSGTLTKQTRIQVQPTVQPSLPKF